MNTIAIFLIIFFIIPVVNRILFVVISRLYEVDTNDDDFTILAVLPPFSFLYMFLCLIMLLPCVLVLPIALTDLAIDFFKRKYSK